MEYKGDLGIDAETEEGWSIVSFIDTGPGILDEHKPRVFEPFFSTKAAGEGVGLGLYVSRSIVERFGGRIEFVSRPGRTVFKVYLRTFGQEAPNR